MDDAPDPEDRTLQTRTAPEAPAPARPPDDAEAEFTRLYQDTYPLMVRFLLRRGAGDASADLAAETFVIAWRRRDEWRPLAPDTRVAWLYGVVRRVLLADRRSHRRSADLAERVAADAGIHGGDRTADHSGWTVEQLAVAEAVDRLSESDRELIRLIAWEGLSPGQAAEVLGCRPGTLTTRLNRARNRLKKLIDASLKESS